MFEVDLLGTEGGMGGEALEKHIDKTINNLLNTMYQAQIKNDPHLRKQVNKQKAHSTIHQEDTWDEDQYTVSSFKKGDFSLEEQLVKEAEKQTLNLGLFQHINQSRQEQLIGHIEQQLFSVDKTNTKALNWAHMIVEDSKYHRKLSTLF